MHIVTSDFINAPTNPDINSGRVVPWSNHGAYHYITHNDSCFLVILQMLCFVMFLISVIALIIEDYRK